MAIHASYAEICARMGLTEGEGTALACTDRYFLLQKVLMAAVPESAAALDRAAQGADVIVASLFAFAAPLVAEKHGVPLVDVVLQPMTMFSAWDPPRALGYERMIHDPRGPIARQWNRTLFGVIRRVLRRKFGPALDAARVRLGMSPAGRAPMFDPAPNRAATLWAFSPVMGLQWPDSPPETQVTGFTLYDSDDGGQPALDPRLAAFLDAGEPPLVFTLGSVACGVKGGTFYAAAAQAARMLGRRAVMLTGNRGEFRQEQDRVWIGYAPHSLLFPRASLVVHHGGIGTCGQALRAGRLQVVVPHFADQNDNGARLEKLGIARRLPRGEVSAERLAAVLRDLLASPSLAELAGEIGRGVAREDGASVAAARIASLLPVRAFATAGEPRPA